MVEKEFSKISIIEERVELMIDPTTSEAEQNPTKRTAHFLKPSLNLNSLPPKLPKIQSFSSSSKPNVVFLCHSTPLKGWQTWVEKLQATHEPVWRKAGIFDAIKGSTCHITKVNDLIFSLVEKWCPETNTFVFPWGEATVTLEDVLILGGFSPLGVDVSVSSDSSSLEKNVERVVNNLIYLYDIIKDKHNQLSQVRWQEHFMGCGYEIEYAGFLALWLARHVFPGTWVIVDDSDEEEEWKLVFGRCLMVGQLSGLDCVQNYNPHRVALQFGFDQDIPESVDISNLGNRMNFKGLKLYIPPRLQEGDITYRYFDWWRTRFDVQQVALVGCKRKNTSDKRVQKMQCVLTSEDEVWNTKLINVSCSKLAETELSRGNELGQVIARCPLRSSEEEDLGKIDDVARERNQERDLIKHDMKMENSIGTPTECNGSLTRVACEALSQDPNTNYSNTQEVAVSLQVMDNCVHNPFAALFLEYESRISRLERYFGLVSF